MAQNSGKARVWYHFDTTALRGRQASEAWLSSALNRKPSTPIGKAGTSRITTATRQVVVAMLADLGPETQNAEGADGAANPPCLEGARVRKGLPAEGEGFDKE